MIKWSNYAQILTNFLVDNCSSRWICGLLIILCMRRSSRWSLRRLAGWQSRVRPYGQQSRGPEAHQAYSLQVSHGEGTGRRGGYLCESRAQGGAAGRYLHQECWCPITSNHAFGYDGSFRSRQNEGASIRFSWSFSVTVSPSRCMDHEVNAYAIHPKHCVVVLIWFVFNSISDGFPSTILLADSLQFYLWILCSFTD